MGDYHLHSTSQSHKPCPLPTPVSSNSFWHSEPDESLLGYRSTEDLPEEVDVVIVGCGITGANAARYLTQSGEGKGFEVMVLEAREVCWGATGRNGGHLQPLLFDRTPEIANFELDNCAEVAKYIHDNKVHCEYRPVSGCRTFWTDGLLKEALSCVDALQKQAPEIGKHVTIATKAPELAEHNVKSSCPGATLTTGAASLWPYKLVTFIIRKLLAEKKINLQTNTPVESITPVSTSGNDQAIKGRWTVQTPRGIVHTKHVLLATNAYTSHLLPTFSDLLVPVRGTMSALLPPPGSSRLPNSYGFVGTGPGANPNSDDYLIQRPFEGVPNPKGHLMFGGGRTSGHLNSMGEADDSVVDEGSVDYLQKILLDTLDLGGEAGSMKELKVDKAWSGIMGYSRDNAPWVGAVPGKKGVWLCAGYTGHGMPNATLCSKAAIDIMLAEEKGEDIEKVQKEMVKAGRVPASYLITEERFSEAQSLPSVKEQDERLSMGYDANGKWTVQGTY